MKPNKFEKAILDAAWNAQKFHIEMTGGEYLWYSHESFLQNFIAIKMFKNKKKAGHYVYVDASPKKIRESSDSASEEDEKDSRQRFDLVFWFKSKNEVKAIVEIKRAWKKNSVMDDIYKLWEYRKTEQCFNSLLARLTASQTFRLGLNFARACLSCSILTSMTA